MVLRVSWKNAAKLIGVYVVVFLLSFLLWNIGPSVTGMFSATGDDISLMNLSNESENNSVSIDVVVDAVDGKGASQSKPSPITGFVTAVNPVAIGSVAISLIVIALVLAVVLLRPAPEPKQQKTNVSELKKWIMDARKAGHKDEVIYQALIQRGWTQGVVKFLMKK